MGTTTRLTARQKTARITRARLGGQAVLKKYGSEHFSKKAKERWVKERRKK